MIARMLDRVYYRGPRSDHFDGERFFNPEDGPPAEAHGRGSGLSFGALVRFWRGKGRVRWPVRLPVVPGVPPRSVGAGAMRATWIGHSTVLVQAGGLTILTDPVWAERASPVSFLGPKRVRAPGVRLAELPAIDLVLLSHNHYDHMDLATLAALWRRDRPLIVTPLGNDTILRGAGVEAVARDWGGRVPVRPGIEVIVERVHHWGSRRGRDRNRALWGGFTVTLPGGNLFFAGDTGWGGGAWIEAARARGAIRLALIPIGAFSPRSLMEPSHVDPAEAAEAFARLGAAHGVAVHWGTFQLSWEAVDAPPRALAEALVQRGIDAGRFRALEPGEAWNVPVLADV